MNPFEAARREALALRSELFKGASMGALSSKELVDAAVARKDIALERVPKEHKLLRGSDATINTILGTMLIRADASDGEAAYLAAHEFGHLELHADSGPVFDVSTTSLMPEEQDTSAARYVESYGVREREELQANVFAREFLLPRAVAAQLFVGAGQSASKIAGDLKLPDELVRLQLYDALLLPEIAEKAEAKAPGQPTPAQAPGVLSKAETTLVQAGPGTGKTTALMFRVRHLIEKGVAPESILVLTFTNKAARELVERLRVSGVKDASRIWVGTFHAFGLEFLRKFGHNHGLKPRFPVLDQLAALSLLEDQLPRIALSHYDALSDPVNWLPEVIRTISRCKDDCISSVEYAQGIVTYSPAGNATAEQLGDAARLFQLYEDTLRAKGMVDLADLILIPLKALQGSDPAVEQYRRRFQHVLVDEYQDINRASALLIKELSKQATSRWLVGDLKQAIYRFRGASIQNLTEFKRDYPAAIEVPLVDNHRSTEEIVEVFNDHADRNPWSIPVEPVRSVAGVSGILPGIYQFDSDEALAELLPQSIEALRKAGVSYRDQAIISYRHSVIAKAAEVLNRQGIPVLYLGSVLERPEIKDLLCLMQLVADDRGSALARDWSICDYRVGATDQTILREAFASGQISRWTDFDTTGLSAKGKTSFDGLKGLLSGITPTMSPWDALAQILLEDSDLLRKLYAATENNAFNARLAIWQFVHFCRNPDGLSSYTTVRTLFDRIRRRIRLGEDRQMREAPPEADGVDAVKLLTAHGSKGLEFEAVHLLDLAKFIFAPANDDQWPLIPPGLLGSVPGESKFERHNLLYVMLSRAKRHLILYEDSREDPIPSVVAMQHRFDVARHETPPAQPMVRSAQKPISSAPKAVDAAKFIRYARCPKQYEYSELQALFPSSRLPVHSAVEQAALSVIEKMAACPSPVAASVATAMVTSALHRFGLDVELNAPQLKERVEELVAPAIRLLALNGHGTREKIEVMSGSLPVVLHPHQVFVQGRTKVARFFIAKESTFKNSLKQPLTYLLQELRQQAADISWTFEGWLLLEDQQAKCTFVQDRTVEKFRSLADAFTMGLFPLRPQPNVCPRCAHCFYCSQRA